MALFSFFRRGTDNVEKAGAPVTPQPIADALTAQGMDSTAQMGPGRPQNPVQGYSLRPRAMDYPAGINISGSPSGTRGSWGRTSFDTLRGIIDAYDIARDCINHKIDELVSMEPLFLPVDGFSGDADAAIAAARAALEFPDRELPFDAWLSKWLEDVFRYDAGTLYRRRNLAGEVIGLEVIDGTTIVPEVDEHGRRPQPPAPAYWQGIKGQSWTWLTSDDVVQTIRRPQPNSPFGLAPIESILLTANTDIRFQWHFMQMFTDGSIPGGFIEVPPDVSSPDQVDEWQAYWDSMTQGDQAKLHQLIAVPAGTKVTETRPKTFDKTFPEYLAVRTAAAYGVVPQDIGIVQDVNRATGETQTDMQFRVNTLPWVRFAEGTLSRYLKYDLKLPVQVKLDTGRDKEDRLTEAQAWQIYVDSGAASVDEMRQELLGLPIDNERPMPRFINSPRTGPVPLRSVFAISGPIDPETGGPADDQPLDTAAFDGAGGVLPDKSPGGTQFKRAPIDPDDPAHPELEHPVPGSDVLGTTPSAKPVIADPAEGTQVEAEQAAADPATVVAAKVKTEDVTKAVSELAAFRRFAKTRTAKGVWRDFQFTTTDPQAAHALNQHGRARVRKAAGQVVAAGLAVVAADTGRVLMLQRALDPADPNGGCWEFPGGCVEDGENPCDAARREWSEETGLDTPYADGGDPTPAWTSPDGVYAGYVQVVPTEADVPIFDRAQGSNPDDPDGDAVEALAWWDPQQLGGNPAVRPELAGTLGVVLPLLEVATPGKAPDPVTKGWRDGAATAPIHAVDLRLTDYWSPRIAAALAKLITPAQLRAAIAAARGLLPADEAVAKAADPIRDSIVQAVTAQLGDQVDTAELEQVIRQVIADGYLAGGLAARKQLGPNAVTIDGQTGAAIHDLSWDTWTPGDVDAAIRAADGGLADLLEQAGVGIKGVTGSALDDLGNAVADGLLDGATVDDVARSLSGWATGFRAERIAHTELARSVDSATQATYVANGIDEFDIVLSDGACPECEDAAADGPYPSGDSIVPVHPLCRCASAPRIPDDWTGSDDTTGDEGDAEDGGDE